MTAITAASESCRSGDAKCSIDSTAPRADERRCRRRERRSRPGAGRRRHAPRAGHPRLVRLGAHAADRRPTAGPVQSSDGAGRGGEPQRVADCPAARADRRRTAGNRADALRPRSGRRPAARDRRRPGDAAAPPRRSRASYIPQLGTQRFARARQPRFHRADRNPERETDFLVTQAVDLAQHERGALIERQPIERRADPLGQLLLPEQRDRAIRRCRAPAVRRDRGCARRATPAAHGGAAATTAAGCAPG